MSRVTDTPPERLALRRVALIKRVHELTPEEARVWRRAAESGDFRALPRRHPGEGRNGWHVLAPEGAYAQVCAWRSRGHWLRVVVPLVLDHVDGRRILRKWSVARGTFLRWARAESLFAGDQSTGRRVIVRPDDLASFYELGSERTVQRCRAAAREMRLLVDVFHGRHLNRDELRVARPHYTEEQWRARWSRQMGLCNESACAVPRWVNRRLAWRSEPGTRSRGRGRAERSTEPQVRVGFGARVTPTEGPAREPRNSPSPGVPSSAPRGRDAREGGAGSAGAVRQGRRGGRRPLSGSQRRAWRLAHGLTRLIPWLSGTLPGLIMPTCYRFANAPVPWTPGDVVTALDRRNAARKLDAPRQVWAPAPLFARMMRDVDPVEQHPNPQLRRRLDAAPAWCGECDRDRRVLELPDGRVRRCPRCHWHRSET